jgi:hypothetical protein
VASEEEYFPEAHVWQSILVVVEPVFAIRAEPTGQDFQFLQEFWLLAALVT